LALLSEKIIDCHQSELKMISGKTYTVELNLGFSGFFQAVNDINNILLKKLFHPKFIV
jgi:hypothetical protein